MKQQLESQHAHFAQKGVQVVAVYIDDEVESWQQTGEKEKCDREVEGIF